MTVTRTLATRRAVKAIRSFKPLPFKSVQNTINNKNVSTPLKQPPTCKSVRFAVTKKVAKLHRSQEDLNKSWYHESEYTAFDQERKRTVAAVHEANGDLSCLDPAEFTVSGLEHHLYRQQMIARKVKTMHHVRSVLKQQYSNRCTGVSDPESLRSVSELFSMQPSKRAHLRGVLDHTLNVMW
jgi:hypothetical protein